MRLMFVLLILLNVAYAAREALLNRSDVSGVATDEVGRRPGSVKLLSLDSEASATGRGGSKDIGVVSAYEETVRDDIHMALGKQALATLLKLPYSEGTGPRARDDFDGAPLVSHIAERAVREAVQSFARRCIKAGPFADGAIADHMLLEMQAYTSEGFVRAEELSLIHI